MALVIRDNLGKFVTGSRIRLGCKKQSSTMGKVLHKQTWSSWKSMRERCNNINSKAYKYYGQRGVVVCERWERFANFLEDMGDRPFGTTLDRLDNSKGYSKDNCRWATKEEQMNNKTTNNILEYHGKRQSLTMWARELGIKRSTLDMRIREYKWSVERALTVNIKTC